MAHFASDARLSSTYFFAQHDNMYRIATMLRHLDLTDEVIITTGCKQAHSGRLPGRLV